MRNVDVNTGLLLHPWIAVLVSAETGITYAHQTGGTVCLPRRIEGYYVPVFSQRGLESLRAIFEVTLNGSGTSRGGVVWTGDLHADLSEAVAQVFMESSVDRRGEVRLILDEARLSEVDEAWVPVTSPDGPGILIWENSD